MITPPVAEILLCSNSNFSPTGAITPPPLAVPPGRPVAMGGRGGFSPPWKTGAPPLGCAVPFAVTIGIEVYPPPLEFCQPPPLLTIQVATALPPDLHPPPPSENPVSAPSSVGLPIVSSCHDAECHARSTPF